MQCGRNLLRRGMVALVFCAGVACGGSLDPVAGPGPTMHTLEEIYQGQAESAMVMSNTLEQLLGITNIMPALAAIQSQGQATYALVEGLASPGVLSDTTTVVAAGTYAATNLALVDVDLDPANIRKDTVLFGLTGAYQGEGSTNQALPARTGQTNSYVAGDDGDLQRGVSGTSPRFVVGTGDETNCVTDNLTGLMWTRNAHLAGPTNWAGAVQFCDALTLGGHADWRLPNIRELTSLLDYRVTNPPLPVDHPFANVQTSEDYWSSTTYCANTNQAWRVSFWDAGLYFYAKTQLTRYVWPVRGGP